MNPNEPKLPIGFHAARLGAALVISTLVLIGGFWILLAPTDERSEQAAITLMTSTVTAWITYFASTRDLEAK